MINQIKDMKTILSQLVLAQNLSNIKMYLHNFGINAAYDDLRTNSNASSSLKKQSGEFSEIVW